MISDNELVMALDELTMEWGLRADLLEHAPVSTEEVPEFLRPLLPYAAIWGLADDWAREKVVRQTPPRLINHLKRVVAQYDDHLDAWLAGPEADSPTPTDSYIAFSAMRMAADFA